MEALKGFLYSIGSYVDAALIQSPEKDLVHYTTLDGFLSILQNGDLWLTDSRYCNDEEELVHGHRVAMKVVEEELSNANDPARKAFLENVRAIVIQPPTQGVFICCFCDRDNLLSQWRGYAAYGTGVSLRIEAGQLSYLTGADCQHGLMRCWRVVYDSDRQEKIVRSAINYSFETGVSAEDAAQRAADGIQFFIPTFKNPDFKEESEWRIIFTPNVPCLVPPSFRVKGSMLAPYYSLSALAAPPGMNPPPPIQLSTNHITVGPSANKNLNVAAIRSFLELRNLSHVTVSASATPFRS